MLEEEVGPEEAGAQMGDKDAKLMTSADNVARGLALDLMGAVGTRRSSGRIG